MINISEQDIKRIADGEELGQFFNELCENGALEDNDKDFVIVHMACYLDDILSKEGVNDFFKDFCQNLKKHYIEKFNDLSKFLFTEFGLKEFDYDCG